MEALMTAIQDRLKGVTGVRDTDVFFSLDPDVIPASAGFPCIGIKDGSVTRHAMCCGVTELVMQVDIAVYDKVGRDENSVRNVLGLTQQVHTALDDNLLDGYVKEVDPGNEDPIRLMYREKSLILRKTIPYQYSREEE